MAMVAHPDDCVIFAWSFMHHHDHFEWSVGYLTYTDQDPRGAELARFWQAKNIACQFLGYPDDYRDIAAQICSFDQQLAQQSIARLIISQDIIITHDEHGDYGHPHHRLVHDAVVANHHRVVTFANRQSGNVEFTIPAPDYSGLDQHRQIVLGFHTDGHKNRYSVPDSVRAMIGSDKA